MPKRIVICADGTWNVPEQRSDTNVVKLASAVLPDDASGKVQVVFYHKGVGERGGLWDHLTGGAFGVGISANIEDLYLFIANNYAPGDELFFFGFSRGAYTVRSLAGLLRNSGVLRREHLARYADAYALYRRRTPGAGPTSAESTAFRKAYAWPDFNITCIGVWDTVGALGIPVTPLRFWTRSRYEFHDVQLSRFIDHAYQALAIDERRKPFRPAVWIQHPQAPRSQVLEQAWFPGVHCDVGGGNPATGLSDGALTWMWNRATSCGLALDSSRALRPNPLAEAGDSMTVFYRLLGDGTRSMATSTALHRSTEERRAAMSAYRPRNLEAYLAAVPNPIVYTP